MNEKSDGNHRRPGPANGRQAVSKGTIKPPAPGDLLTGLLFDKAPVGLIVTDLDGNILDVNPVLREMAGYQNGDLQGLKINAIYMDPEDRRQVLTTLKADGYARNIELRWKRKDGSTWCAILNSNLISINGRDLILSCLKDATDNIRIREALNTAEDKFTKLFNACPIAIALVCLEDGRFLNVNDEFTNMTGWSREDAIGRTDIDLALWADPPDRELHLLEISTAGHTNGYELQLRNRQGEIRVGLSSSELIVIDDRPCVIVTCMDITARKRTEDALRESQNFLESVMNAIPVRVFWKDRDLCYQGCNSLLARDAGYKDPEEIVGKDDYQMPWKEQAEKYRRDDQTIIDRELPLLLYEEPQTTAAGETIHLMTSKIPLRNAKKEVVGILGIYLDITKEKKLQAQLQMSQKMEAVGQLAGGVAHDFNNLLQVISGYANLVAMELPGASPALDNLRIMSEAVERAADLTKQLLTFSRRQVLKMESLDLNCLIKNFLKMIARILGERIRIDFNEGELNGNIKADRGMIEQVLMNLCINARDAMPNGGKLFIETKEALFDKAYCQSHPWANAGRYLSLKVTDTGCGMDAQTVSRIFEPFFTTKEHGKGTGLGLATVYGIVKQHSGSISVYSEPGQGSAFTIYLPVSEEKMRSPIESMRPASSYRGDETILLADDDATIRDLSVKYLEQAGYTVIAAANGLEAVTLYQKHKAKIRLLFTDVMMPEMTGIAAFMRIHEIDPKLPVVFCSGYSDHAVFEKYGLDRGLPVVQKPCPFDEILKLIRQTLDAQYTGVE